MKNIPLIFNILLGFWWQRTQRTQHFYCFLLHNSQPFNTIAKWSLKCVLSFNSPFEMCEEYCNHAKMQHQHPSSPPICHSNLLIIHRTNIVTVAKLFTSFSITGKLSIVNQIQSVQHYCCVMANTLLASVNRFGREKKNFFNHNS